MAKGFTLIEILIVVAIVAILAAIAIPNYLEAQTRAKISRVKADMRNIATAVEAYATDNTTYAYSQIPLNINRDWVAPGGMPIDGEASCGGLTTPVQYISSIPLDIFDNRLTPTDGIYNALHYVSADFGFNRTVGFEKPMTVMVPSDSANGPIIPTHGTGPDIPIQDRVNGKVPTPWLLFSMGPDGVSHLDTNNDGNPEIRSVYNLNNIYDPTNGSYSPGNIIRYPGGQDRPN